MRGKDAGPEDARPISATGCRPLRRRPDARAPDRPGLTQQQMAELIDVTYQQAHKYEKGINRIASGRLYCIAQALGVEIGYFFEGVDRDNRFEKPQQQRLQLELARNMISIPIRKHQEAICSLTRALSDPDAGH
jgi:transcriptional regulator with XRE-family HTH domain